MFDWKKRKVKILSIDGGGIRGLIPALVLKELEGRLRKHAGGKSFSAVFDLLAGTSTGAFIAMGLALPQKYPHRHNVYLKEPAMNAADIAEFYIHRGADIFPQNILTGFRAMAQVFREKYDVGRLESILEEVFGTTTLEDCLTNILIPAYDTARGKPLLFKNGFLNGRSSARSYSRWSIGERIFEVRGNRRRFSGTDEEPDLNFYLKDVARAASAAPTYFPPARVNSVPYSKETYCLIDGGIFAPNPSMCAYVEARKLYPRAREFVILSLGTGRTSRNYGWKELQDWGYLEWMSPIKKAPLPSIMLKGQRELTDYEMRSLRDVRYFRLNASLEGANVDMDDASRQNIARLRRIAEKILRKHDEEMNDICRLLES